MAGSGIHFFGLPLAGDPASGWRRHPLFGGPMGGLTFLSCHVSVLGAGATPHPPHAHADEEILLMLDGEADLAYGGTAAAGEGERLRPGQFIHYPAGHFHTLRNPGPRDATYLMFRWHAEGESRREAALGRCTTTFPLAPAARRPGGDGFDVSVLLEGATRHLARLHAHLTVLHPGCGYPSHADAHDVALVTLAGEVETLGQRVPAHSVVFYAAGEPHGMANGGRSAAVYLVFEFHP
ncbi:MAG: cupin domain-containing protein [Rhodocyclaceae bacterium]|nr:cupin domain-containing protein [Rhodocyclaceae bacterium]